MGLLNMQVAGGSVMGRGHVGSGNTFLGQNNQDAFRISPGPDFFIGVVADGCGSAMASEVGANLGAELLTVVLRQEFEHVLPKLTPGDTDPLPESFWERVDVNFIGPLNGLMRAMTGSTSAFRVAVGRYLLFTTVGVLHSSVGTWFFGPKGIDGVLVVNGQIKVLTPPEHNSPVYVGYRLVGTQYEDRPQLMRTCAHIYVPPGQLESFLIASDGATELLEKSDRKIPGSDELVGPIARLWAEDRFFTETGLSDWLLGLNREIRRIERPEGGPARMKKESGLLSDDTTMIVGRRVSATQGG